MLDLSRSDVCDYIIKSISDVLNSAPISYVKWDYNRNFSEMGSAALTPECQQEQAHRYILGLYNILEELNKRFPDVLFEGCSGGGGRFDPGMLYYIWEEDGVLLKNSVYHNSKLLCNILTNNKYNGDITTEPYQALALEE